MKNAFTMVELVFVIIVIGILSVVAVPKLAPIVGSAKDTKAATTLSSVRSALSTERQKRILRGKFKPLTDLGDDTYAFKTFKDADGDTGVKVLEYPIKSCSYGGCWERISGPKFKYHFSSSKAATFELDNNRLVCADDDTSNCEELLRQ